MQTATMIERDYSHVATTPEIELLEVIRLAHLQHFTVAVTQGDDGCHIRLSDRDTGRFLEARGVGFEEAWRALTSPDLRGLDLTFGEKIATRGRSAADNFAVVGRTAQ